MGTVERSSGATMQLCTEGTTADLKRRISTSLRDYSVQESRDDVLLDSPLARRPVRSEDRRPSELKGDCRT